MSNFKVGDVVVCIDNKYTGLSLSEEYVVANVRFGWVELAGFPTVSYDSSRFEKVEQDNNTKTNNIISGLFHTETRTATVAYEYNKDTKQFKLGIAYCNPRDEFVKSEGIRLAKKRLEESPEIVSLKFLEKMSGGRLFKEQGPCYGFKHIHDFLPWALQPLV